MREVVDRRDQLAGGEVAGRAEDDDDGRRRTAVLAQAVQKRVAGFFCHMRAHVPPRCPRLARIYSGLPQRCDMAASCYQLIALGLSGLLFPFASGKRHGGRPGQMIPFREKRRVLVVHHLRWQTPAERDLDDIEAERARRRRELPEVGLHRPTQRAFLALVHRMITADQRTLGACLHLNENEHVSIATNQVDLIALVARAAPVARYDGITLAALEKVRRPPVLRACPPRSAGTEPRRARALSTAI